MTRGSIISHELCRFEVYAHHHGIEQSAGHETSDELVAAQGPKSYFGELSLLYEQVGSVTVKAQTDGVLWAVRRARGSSIQELGFVGK